MADGGSRDRDRIADPWGRRTPYGAGQTWPVRVDQQLAAAEQQVERWVPSACVLCSNGCGLDIGVAGGRIVGVRRGRRPAQVAPHPHEAGRPAGAAGG
jgi:anaerobic selenocysteine-containing dehydrogenase